MFKKVSVNLSVNELNLLEFLNFKDGKELYESHKNNPDVTYNTIYVMFQTNMMNGARIKNNKSVIFKKEKDQNLKPSDDNSTEFDFDFFTLTMYKMLISCDAESITDQKAKEMFILLVPALMEKINIALETVKQSKFTGADGMDQKLQDLLNKMLDKYANHQAREASAPEPAALDKVQEEPKPLVKEQNKPANPVVNMFASKAKA